MNYAHLDCKFAAHLHLTRHVVTGQFPFPPWKREGGGGGRKRRGVGLNKIYFYLKDTGSNLTTLFKIFFILAIISLIMLSSTFDLYSVPVLVIRYRNICTGTGCKKVRYHTHLYSITVLEHIVTLVLESSVLDPWHFWYGPGWGSGFSDPYLWWGWRCGSVPISSMTFRMP